MASTFAALFLLAGCASERPDLPEDARIEEAGSLLIGLLVHSADVKDRDGVPAILKSIGHAFPWLRHVFADGVCFVSTCQRADNSVIAARIRWNSSARGAGNRFLNTPASSL